MQYKQLKIEFYFSNESYDEEQEIVLYHRQFSLCKAPEKHCIESASLIFIAFIIYVCLAILN